MRPLWCCVDGAMSISGITPPLTSHTILYYSRLSTDVSKVQELEVRPGSSPHVRCHEDGD